MLYNRKIQGKTRPHRNKGENIKLLLTREHLWQYWQHC